MRIYSMMIKILILLLLCTSSLNADDEQEYSDFLRKFRNNVLKTSYNTTARKKVFMERLTKIKEHNLKYQEGEEWYEMGVNHLSDYVKIPLILFIRNKLIIFVSNFDNFFKRHLKSFRD